MVLKAEVKDVPEVAAEAGKARFSEAEIVPYPRKKSCWQGKGPSAREGLGRVAFAVEGWRRGGRQSAPGRTGGRGPSNPRESPPHGEKRFDYENSAVTLTVRRAVSSQGVSQRTVRGKAARFDP